LSITSASARKLDAVPSSATGKPEQTAPVASSSGTNKIVLPSIARQPGEARCILMQHHSYQRPARPLLAMR
jgi:hypothetical protein